MSVVREREAAAARRALEPCVRMLIDAGARGSAEHLATLRGERVAHEAIMAMCNASPVAPPMGALNWHGYEQEFQGIGNTGEDETQG